MHAAVVPADELLERGDADPRLFLPGAREQGQEQRGSVVRGEDRERRDATLQRLRAHGQDVARDPARELRVDVGAQGLEGELARLVRAALRAEDVRRGSAPAQKIEQRAGDVGLADRIDRPGRAQIADHRAQLCFGAVLEGLLALLEALEPSVEAVEDVDRAARGSRGEERGCERSEEEGSHRRPRETTPSEVSGYFRVPTAGPAPHPGGARSRRGARTLAPGARSPRIRGRVRASCAPGRGRTGRDRGRGGGRGRRRGPRPRLRGERPRSRMRSRRRAGPRAAAESDPARIRPERDPTARESADRSQ